MQGSRLKFITYLQIIGIILVVFGHSFHTYPDGNHGHSLLIYRMLFSFRMPLFIFTSGFLLQFTITQRPRNVKTFLKDKFKRLMIPFLVLSLLTFIPRTMMGAYADDALALSWESLAKSLVLRNNLVIPYFWFLHTSFTLLAIIGTILILTHSNQINEFLIFSILIIIVLIINISPITIPSVFSLNMTSYLALYFLLGCVYARWTPQIDSVIRWDSWPVFMAFAALWAGLFFIRDVIGFAGIVLCATSGICMTISLAKIMVSKNIRILDHLSGANYIIFLLSWYFNVAAQQILSHFVTLPWWVYTTLSLTSGIYIPWLFYIYLNRHPHTPLKRTLALLLGQKLK